MPRFELEWTMQGRAVVEGDDPGEAEQFLHEGLTNLDTQVCDEFDVLEITTDSAGEAK